MAPVKIVCLIGTPAYLNYFINEIGAAYPPALVIREDARTQTNIYRKIVKKGMLKSLRILWKRLKSKKRRIKDYQDILGNQWQQASANFPLMNTADINSAEVAAKLREIKPDLVLVHGTSLIRDSTLAGIPLVLNLHWGLSPYYKGSYCTEWALINHDPFNIGFTIHRISSKIDGGDVLTQERIAIGPDDTANRINMRLTKEGTQEMIRVISRLMQQEQPVFARQDDTAGRLYLTRHWTYEQQQALAGIENKTALARMIANPARSPLPVVKW